VQLFDDAKKRKEKENKRREISTDPECTFSPNIKLTKNFRALHSHSPVKRSKVKEDESKVDLKTGRPLYRPQVGRAPKNRLKRKSIGDHLYDLRKKKSIDENITSSTSSFTQEKSNQLVEKLRTDCFRMIFSKLDGDKDGIISQTAINTQSIPESINKMYLPVIQEMNYMNCTLNMQEFIDASNCLFKELTIKQKHEFLQYYKSLSNNKVNNYSLAEHSFKVIIFISLALY